MSDRTAPQLEVDASVNAAYIRFSAQEVAATIEVTADVQVDVDATGRAVGVELLDLGAAIPAGLIARRFQLDANQKMALRQVGQVMSGYAITISTGSGTGSTMLAAAVG